MRYLILLVLFSCTSQERAKLKLHPLPTGKVQTSYEAIAANYMVSSQGESTTKAALAMLEKGGNVADAAVAASFAISVERPHSTGLGGGGFIVSRFNKKVETYDFREMAPQKSHEKMYLNKKGKVDGDKSLTGPLAVGVPGLVKGLFEFHQAHGKLKWSEVIAPAIKLASEGFKIYPGLAEAIEYSAKRLCLFPSSRSIFLKNGCRPRLEGELLVQKDLANSLRLIAESGVGEFYRGSIAKNIVATSNSFGGILTERDFKLYKVKKRDPVVGSFRGNTIYSMPPPSSGGAHVIQILNILENFKLSKLGPTHPEAINTMAQAMQLAFADRATHMGDRDYKPFPLEKIISKPYAKKQANLIKPTGTLKSEGLDKINLSLLNSPDHTTHFTIADIEGNIVSSTQTINGWFGSALVAKNTGIVLNNEMDDFATHVGGSNLFGAIGGVNNLPEPGKRPLSSMSPTIVLDKKGNPLMAVGTPSGTRILTCVMQTIFNYLEYELPLWQAVNTTRIHHQWYPEEIRIGPPYYSDEVMSTLESYGNKINKKSLGCKIQAITYENGKLHGVSDAREEGMSAGL